MCGDRDAALRVDGGDGIDRHVRANDVLDSDSDQVIVRMGHLFAEQDDRLIGVSGQRGYQRRRCGAGCGW